MNIAFGIYQTGSRANGGVESITQIIESLGRGHSIVIFTNLESPTCGRWRAVGARVVVMGGVSMGKNVKLTPINVTQKWSLAKLSLYS